LDDKNADRPGSRKMRALKSAHPSGRLTNLAVGVGYAGFLAFLFGGSGSGKSGLSVTLMTFERPRSQSRLCNSQ
jgi:ABC-type ATPase involved in cell division